MATPHNVIRVIGASAGGEVWSINPRYATSGDGPVTAYADLLAWTTAIAALNSNAVWPTTLLGLLSSSGSITAVRAEYIDAEGNLAQAAETTLPTPATGSGVPSKPQQTAWCVSLLTGRPGRSYRGRLYLPAWSNPSLDAGFRVVAASRTTTLTAFNSWLRAVGDACPTAGTQGPVVVSQTRGTLAFVTQVQLGDILDTQRRRRDSMVEQRTTQNLV